LGKLKLGGQREKLKSTTFVGTKTAEIGKAEIGRGGGKAES